MCQKSRICLGSGTDLAQSSGSDRIHNTDETLKKYYHCLMSGPILECYSARLLNKKVATIVVDQDPYFFSFLGPDPDPLVQDTDPALAPDPSLIK